MGYVFINDLVKKIGGQIYIKSLPSEGTDVKIKWKVKLKKIR